MALAPLTDHAGLRAIPLMQCPIAGFQFHGGEACWGRIKADDRLVLRREPGNRHDARAITVAWQDVMLGYVPREANYALSQMMDRGIHAEGRVRALRPGSDPWQRVMMEIVVSPRDKVAPQPAPPTEHVPVCGALTMRPGKWFARGASRDGWALSDADYDMGLRVFLDCVSEVTRRLVLPVTGAHEKHRRLVRLWDAVEIEIGADGRGLGARYLEADGSPAVPISADLAHPIGPGRWLTAFSAILARAWQRRGVSEEHAARLQRWLRCALRDALDPAYDFEPQRRAVLAFLAPDPLARSLANRAFDHAPSAELFNWVCTRIEPIALVGVERSAMLPFLRMAFADARMAAAADPLAALHERLAAAGIEPAAWRKLHRWGFGPFAMIDGGWLKEYPVARLANCFHRLSVQAPPPPLFAVLAIDAALHRLPPNAKLDFERHPAWFMRSLLNAAEAAPQSSQQAALRDALPGCLDWLLEARPSPDANQQHAGWPWILEQARVHHKARDLALAAPWAVPAAGMPWGPYRVVAIRCAAELAAEAEAMKNCLANYEEACRAGDIVVFSIRRRSTGARIACFAAERCEDGGRWELVEIAGKMNATVDEAVERIAHAMVAKLNGGRGGEVPPF